ncbi:MAG: hypothetical protein ABIR30_13085 [Chitinophagaceae bacterium]
MTRMTSNSILSCLFSLTSFFCFAQQKEVVIRIAQDQSYLLDSSEQSLVLERKQFKINVLLENVEGVYCFASFSDSLYRLADTDMIPGFTEIQKHLFEEAAYNKEKELWISNDGWGYWYYKIPPASHRFNRKIVLLDGNRLVASKSIKQVYLPATKEQIKLKDLRRTLYLFFIAIAESGPDGTPLKELMRRKVRIDWVDEDYGKGPSYNFP